MSLSEVFKSATDVDAKAQAHRLAVKEEPYAVSGRASESENQPSPRQRCSTPAPHR